MLSHPRSGTASNGAVDSYTRIVLTAIALFLGILVLQNAMSPVPVQAQSDSPSLYIEPGLTKMRNPNGPSEVLGKLVIDLKTGDAWGFPTVFTTGDKPPVTKPTYLGRYDFSAMKK
jgi:hypothetical protein